MNMLEFNLKSNRTALEVFFSALNVLRDQKILINNKDFTCQIGEWLVEMLYDGKRATSGIQKGWDVEAQGKHFQVKTHAKAETNSAKFSAVEKESAEQIDELIIIVFTFDYKLKEFYKVPWSYAYPNIKLRGKKNPRYEINWSSIKHYKIALESLPHQEVVNLFR